MKIRLRTPGLKESPRYAFVLAILALLAISAKADSIFNITFTDTDASPTLSNAAGTFTLNTSDQVTGMTVSATVLKPYVFGQASGSPGVVLTFTQIQNSGPLTYNPATHLFGSGTNFYFGLYEAGTWANSAFMNIQGGEPILGNYYTIAAFSQQIFHTEIAHGTWTVSSSGPPPAAPEPAAAGLLGAGLGALLWLARRTVRQML